MVTPDEVVRMRKDLEWHVCQTRQGVRWTMYDPITGRHFRFSRLERRILEGFARTGVNDRTLTKLRADFPDTSIELDDLRQLATFATILGLIPRQKHNSLTSSRSIGSRIKSATDAVWKLLFSKMTLFNPQPFLERILPRTSWIFSSRGVLVGVLAIIIAILCVVSRWREVAGHLPSLEQLFSPQMLLGFGFAFVLTRIVHELGHALSCVRFGQPCTETGVFFMMGVACPYVDVSRSWKLPHAWQRAAVAMAGIYTELCLGAIFTFIWFFTEPSAIHSFSWKVMVVCSLSTLLFNANPLMKYDGYFVLSDCVDVPNLRERSFQAFYRSCATLVLGRKPLDPFNRRGESATSERYMAIFGLLSGSYRMLLLSGIAMAVMTQASRWNLTWLGVGVISILALSMIVSSGSRLIGFTRRDLKTKQLRPIRTAFGYMVAFGLFGAMLFLPIPQRVFCDASVVSPGLQPIFSPISGELTTQLRANHQNAESRGETQRQSEFEHAFEDDFLTVRDELLAVESLDKVVEVKQALSQLAIARRVAATEPETLNLLPVLESRFQLSESQLQTAVVNEQRQTLIHRLEPGQRFVFAHARSSTASSDRDALDGGNASQLSLGSFSTPWQQESRPGRIQNQQPVHQGQLLGWLIDSPNICLDAWVVEEALASIQVGYRTRIELEQWPGKMLIGRISDIHQQREDGRALPGVPYDPNQNAGKFLIRIEIDDLSDIEKKSLVMGGRARVVVCSTNRSLASRIGEWVARNVRLR